MENKYGVNFDALVEHANNYLDLLEDGLNKMKKEYENEDIDKLEKSLVETKLHSASFISSMISVINACLESKLYHMAAVKSVELDMYNLFLHSVLEDGDIEILEHYVETLSESDINSLIEFHINNS